MPDSLFPRPSISQEMSYLPVAINTKLERFVLLGARDLWKCRTSPNISQLEMQVTASRNLAGHVRILASKAGTTSQAKQTHPSDPGSFGHQLWPPLRKSASIASS